jgi:hypothetical protein
MDDRQVGHEPPGTGDLEIEPAERRARIAGEERGGVQTGRAVAAQLLDRYPGQCLDAGQEDLALLASVAVGQRVVVV